MAANLRDMFLCKSCNIKFTMKFDLQQHCEAHHSEKLRWSSRIFPACLKSHHRCAECDLSFENEMRLEFHQQTHTGRNQHACEECGAMFTTEVLLEFHADLHKARRFACTRCDLDFGRRSSLLKHCIRHHPLPEPEYDHGVLSCNNFPKLNAPAPR